MKTVSIVFEYLLLLCSQLSIFIQECSCHQFIIHHIDPENKADLAVNSSSKYEESRKEFLKLLLHHSSAMQQNLSIWFSQTGYRFDPNLGVLAMRVDAGGTSHAVTDEWTRLVLSHLVPNVVITEEAGGLSTGRREGAPESRDPDSTLVRQTRVDTAWAAFAPAGDGARSILVQWYHGTIAPSSQSSPQTSSAPSSPQTESEISVVHTPFRRWRRSPEIKVFKHTVYLYLCLFIRLRVCMG